MDFTLSFMKPKEVPVKSTILFIQGKPNLAEFRAPSWRLRKTYINTFHLFALRINRFTKSPDLYSRNWDPKHRLGQYLETFPVGFEEGVLAHNDIPLGRRVHGHDV
jgi:hypothetical protein